MLSANLGLKGFASKIKFVEGLIKTGSMNADLDAEFFAGQLATIKDNGAGPVVTPVTANTDPVIGMFYCDRVDAFYTPVYKEKVTIKDGVINTEFSNLKASTIKITTIAGTACVKDTDYTVTDESKGIFAVKAGGNLVGETEALVSYRFKDVGKTGISNVDISGKAALIEGFGKLSTLIYDIHVSYTVGGKVYSSAAGLITSATGGVELGTVIKAPTNEDPELVVKIKL